MATLNFHGLINGKNENFHLLLHIFHCRYFDESFLEMFDEWSSTKHNFFVLSKPLNLIGCHGNQKSDFAKNIQNSTQKLYGR